MSTFQEAAKAFLISNRSKWRSPKHAREWENTLLTYAYPHLGNIPCEKITVSHILDTLMPIWNRPVLASRLRSRIATVLAYSAVLEGRTQSNPAAWTGNLAAVLPSPASTHTPIPMAAYPWRNLPRLMARLDDCKMADRALRWTILTACRRGETMKATREQVDPFNRIWTLPQGSTKNGNEHRIPLHPSMTPWLRSPGLLFPSLGEGAMLLRLKELAGEITLHGFRSAFADWARDDANAPEELIEAALGHTHPSATWRAYARSDLLERRRPLMCAWYEFAHSKPAAPKFDLTYAEIKHHLDFGQLQQGAVL